MRKAPKSGRGIRRGMVQGEGRFPAPEPSSIASFARRRRKEKEVFGGNIIANAPSFEEKRLAELDLIKQLEEWDREDLESETEETVV